MLHAVSKPEFDAAIAQSNQDRATPSGKRYTRQFEDKIFLSVSFKAMEDCLSRSPNTVEPVMLVFLISADGKIRRVLPTPGVKYAECIVSRLRLPISVSRPPHDNFAVAIGVANNTHAQEKTHR